MALHHVGHSYRESRNDFEIGSFGFYGHEPDERSGAAAKFNMLSGVSVESGKSAQSGSSKSFLLEQ
jgi:hypothetical protein